MLLRSLFKKHAQLEQPLPGVGRNCW